ncbi:putative ribonuclease H-like domain-containing protein [Tanacetum coccineum]
MAEQDIPPPTITAMKIPIIRKGEYDIWSMRMRQYICHTDHNLWDVIVNGDLEEEPAPTTGETSAPPAPKTAKQLAARRNQERVKSILLLAIPDEYLLKFHNVADAKSLWEAIKSRFGGYIESKKTQKNKLISQLEVHGAPISKEDINQKFLRSLPSSWNQIALIMRNKPDIDDIDIDDLYNNLRVYEDELKRSLGSNSASQNLDFLSSENTGSINEVSTASGYFRVSTAGGINQVQSTPCAHDIAYSFLAQPTTSPQLENKDFQSDAPTNESSSQAQVAQDGLGGYDWSNDFEVEPVNYALTDISSSSSSSSSDSENYELKCREIKINNLNLELEKAVKERDELKDKIAKWEESTKNLEEILKSQMSARDKTGLGYSTQLNELSSNHETDSENSLSIFDGRSSDDEHIPENDRFSKNGYKVVPPPITGNFLTPRADISFAGLDEYAIRNKIIESQTTELNNKTDETAGKTNDANTEKPKSVSESVVSNPKINRDSGNPKILLQDHAVVDSGCSSHMTGNKAYLSDYEDYNGGFMAFGVDPKEVKIRCLLALSFLMKVKLYLELLERMIVYSLDLKNIVPSGGITCLYANATADESKLWHRRLGHVNFKNINKLVKGHLVRGLPSKVFVNDHTCVACKKGKQHKASCKAKLERIIRKPLELLHMDLFGPVSIESINKKRYCLVVTDDFSRFSWVFFLATKDETSEILCNLIIGLEKQLNHNVKIIRCDNGTEFKNHAMNEFCAKKGIKREFSVARTPQQNGVAERKNRTLIEAARTMLADSLLPIPFWAEAVNTACYVLNRVLVTKPQNKTPYELLIGKSPSISFMRPFGCPLTILNTLDSLGKFDGKSDEGYLLGYSTSSKAFRVYNKRTKRVEENLHINFLEDQPNVAGTGPNWMFDLDFLTNSMNYIPVSVENQVNVDAGTQDSYVAGSSGKDKGHTQEYILLQLQPHRTRIPVKDVVQDAQEKPSENASSDKDVKDSKDAADKEEQHQMRENEKDLQDELEMMVTQELAAKAMDDVSRQAFEEEKRRITSQKKAAQATSTNADESSFVYLGGKIPIDASTLPNADLPIDPNMPALEDASDTLPNDGIFNGAYDDDEDVGAVADFNNMDNTIVVSPIPTLKIYKDHPQGQILGDLTLAV